MVKKSEQSDSNEKEEVSPEEAAINIFILSVLGLISTIVTALALKWGVPF